MSDAVRDSIKVKAPSSAVMDVITDVEAYPDWQDEIKAAEALALDERERPLRARFTVDAKMLRTTYTLAYRYEADTVAWELEEGDQLEELTGAYRLRDAGDGTTDVSYELTVVPKIRLPGLVRRQAAKRIVDGALKGLKRRVESGA